MARRWDGDERGEGVADAAAFAAGAEALLDAMRARNWVAEEPEAHLLPHLRRSLESLPLELLEARTSGDGSFDVDLRWTGERRRLGHARAAVFALVGSFAESATYVHQRSDDGVVRFEIVTGMLEGESAFAPHGHTLRIGVAGIG